MKKTKVTYFTPSSSSKTAKKKQVSTEKDKNLNRSRRRFCRACPWCSIFLPILLLFLLICGVVAGIVLALKLSPISNTETTTTTFSIGQTTLPITGGNATATIFSNGTTVSVSNASTTTSVLTTLTTTLVTFCANWTWNTTGITIAGNGSNGSALNQLNSPWNIYLDPGTNILYIADSQNHRIVKWLPNASSGIVIAGTGSQGTQANELNTPRDVFVDSSDNLYVADANNQRIQFFSNGTTQASTISNNWGLGAIYGIFMYNKSIYACDYTSGTVWKNGTAVAGHQGLGSNSNQLNQPQGFTIDTLYNQSTIYIANSQQQTIVQWLSGASTGTIVAGSNNVRSNSSTTLNFPVAIRIDSFSNLFVVDNNNHRIQLFCRYPTNSSNGRTIAGITGSQGTSSTLLNYPAGLALDSSMNLYVSDTSNHRIQKFMRLP